MSALTDFLERFRPQEIERTLGLRPANPRVVLEIDRDELALVRFKPTRRGRPLLESYRLQRLEEPGAPATLFDQEMAEPAKLSERFREMFDRDGARPGRVGLVLPDNVAKVSLVTLPERPPSRRQLEEALRFKMRRAVPFRLSEAMLSYQLLSGGRGAIDILVALARKSIVERYEHALEALGCRLGLVDLCTPNVLNLCSDQVKAAAAEGGDVALLNCAKTYFSLALVRDSRLVFFRCKTMTMGNDGEAPAINGTLAREISSSFSYYEEKLAGQGVGTLLVRTVTTPFEEISRHLEGLPVDKVKAINLDAAVETADGQRLEAAVAQRFAPAIGAATKRLSMHGIDLNLASRPFKNDTLPWVGLVVGAVALVMLTAWNVQAYRGHSSLRSEIEGKKANINAQMLDLERRDREALREIDRFDLPMLGARSAKANEVIRWKAFSWTRLFNKLQEVQPFDVQMTTIRPVFEVKSADRRRPEEEDDDIQRVPVAVEGVAKTLVDFLAFERSLIEDPHFDRVEPENTARDGVTNETVFRLRFVYDPFAEARAAPVEDVAVDAKADPDAEAAEGSEPAPEQDSVEPVPGTEVAATKAAEVEGDEVEIPGSTIAADDPATPADDLAQAVTANDRIERPNRQPAAQPADAAATNAAATDAAAQRPRKGRRGGRRGGAAGRDSISRAAIELGDEDDVAGSPEPTPPDAEGDADATGDPDASLDNVSRDLAPEDGADLVEEVDPSRAPEMPEAGEDD